MVRQTGGPGQGRRAVRDGRPRPEAVRALLKTLDRPRPVRVVLRAGTYYLDSPLELGPEDSGSRDAPVVYAAAAGETVTLSGGRRLRGGRWGEVNGHKAWTVDIPEVKAGSWRFRQLFVNGGRRPRTRLPKRGRVPDRIAPRLHRRLPPQPDQAVRLRPGRHRPRLAQPPGRGGRRDHEVAGQPAADRGRRREVAHRHLRPPEPVRPPLRRPARALLGGERRRGPRHARPVVSRSPAGTSSTTCRDRGRRCGRPRSSPRVCPR